MMVMLINFLFRNFFLNKNNIITVLYLNLGCFHHNFTEHKHCLSVYLENNCTEFVGKSVLDP